MNRLLCAACFLLAISSPLHIQAAESQQDLVDQMNVLLNAGRYEEAYTLGQTGLFDYEGEANFDFAYGLAALESGRPDEAVFAFERIAFNNPDQQRVKLELARAYFLSENYAASETLFNEVLATNPSQNVRSNIEAFLALIDQAQQAGSSILLWGIGYNTGYDSNINSATELGVIATPIGDVTLSEGGQQTGNQFREFRANVSYTSPIDNSRNVVLQANYSNRNNLGTDQFDLDVGSVQMGYNLGLNRSVRYNHALRVQTVRLDDYNFQKSYSFLSTVRHLSDDGWSQSLTGAYTAVRYDESNNPNAKLRDINQFLVSVTMNKASTRNLLSMSMFYGDDNVLREAAKNNETTFVGAAVSDQFLLTQRHLLYARASVQNSDHEASDPIFSVQRENSTSSLSLGWIWQLHNTTTITTDYTLTDNDSNIELYSYDRRRFQVGASFQF